MQKTPWISFIKLSIGKPKYRFLKKEFRNNSFKLLDVGGGRSVQEIKNFFPACSYYCIDLKRPDYKTLISGFTKKFWEMDLTELNFNDIPNTFFDAIIMTHIIEHLPNGDSVLEKILPKLKNGGVIYIEFPGLKSTRLPSMPGALNFCDDKTHCRLYTLVEIYNILLKNHFKLCRGGTRRNWIRIFLMPLLVPYKFIKTPKSIAYEFWDLAGFSEFVFARKIATETRCPKG